MRTVTSDDDDMIVYLQTVQDDIDRYTLVVGIARSDVDIRQHIVRRLDERALAALQHDIDSALDADEDLEPVLTCWCAMQEG